MRKFWCYLFGHSWNMTWISPDHKVHGLGTCERCGYSEDVEPSMGSWVEVEQDE
jgi:hypothetical protein